MTLFRSIALLLAFCALDIGAGEARDFPCADLLARVSPLGPQGTRREYLYHEYDTPEGPYHDVLVIEEFDSPRDLVTHVVRREMRQGAAPTEVSRRKAKLAAGQPRDWHHDLAMEVVNKTIQKYESRRGWSKHKREELRELGDRFLQDSIYVAVTRKSTGQLMGGMRFILAPYGIRDGTPVADGHLVHRYYGPVSRFKDVEAHPEGDVVDEHGLPLPPNLIPEEGYLAIRVPRPSALHPEDWADAEKQIPVGMIVEVGAYVMEDESPKDLTPDGWRKMRAEVRADLHLQHARFVFEEDPDEFTYEGKAFHAYADPASRRMYTPSHSWGWDLLRQYRKVGKAPEEIHHAEDRTPPPITVEEREDDEGKRTDWWPIIHHPERIEMFHRFFEAGQVPKFEEANLAERRRALQDDSPLSIGYALESVDELMALWDRGTARMATAAAISLGRLVHRVALHQKKERRAAHHPLAFWAKPSKTDEFSEVLSQVRTALRTKLQSPDETERLRALYVAGACVSTGIEGNELGPKAALESFFLPALTDGSPQVRKAALMEMMRLYPSADLVRLLAAGASRKEALREATRRLHQAGWAGEELERRAGPLRDWLDFQSEFPNYLENVTYLAGGTLEQSAATFGRTGKDPALAKALLVHALLARGSLPATSDFKDRVDRWIGEMRGAAGPDRVEQLARRVRREVFDRLLSPSPAKRIEAAVATSYFVDRAGFGHGGLDRETVLRKILVPLVTDQLPIVSQAALHELQRQYGKREIARILGGSDPDAALRRAHATLAGHFRNFTLAGEALRDLLHEGAPPPAPSISGETPAHQKALLFSYSMLGHDRVPGDVIEALLLIASSPHARFP